MLIAQLQVMQQIIRERESLGYSAEQPEFMYQYNPMNDLGVCATCTGLAGLVISGSALTRHFPYAVQYSVTEWFAHVHPHCRCILKMINANEACAILLYNDLVIVT